MITKELINKILDGIFTVDSYLPGDIGKPGSIGRNIERRIKKEFKILDNNNCFNQGVDVPESILDYPLEVKSRCIDARSNTQIGAISTKELSKSIKKDWDFDQTDFADYCTVQYWVLYNKFQKVVKTMLIDMSVHKDVWERAFYLLQSQVKLDPKIKYFSVSKGLMWEKTTSTQWHLRVTQNKLMQMNNGAKSNNTLNLYFETEEDGANLNPRRIFYT